MHQGKNTGSVSILYHNNDLNEEMIGKFWNCLPAFMYRYLLDHKGFSLRSVNHFMNAFDEVERLTAPDSKWDEESYKVTTLANMSTQGFLQHMGDINMLDTPKELMEQALLKKKEKQFSSNAMNRVAEAMHFKDDCAISDVHGDAASVLTDGTNQTNGQDSLRSVTSRDLRMNLPLLRQEFNRLKMRLLELSPEDKTFQLPAFQEDIMDSLSVNSSATSEMVKNFKSTKMNCALLNSRIAEIEHGSPPESGSAASAPSNASKRRERESEMAQGE